MPNHYLEALDGPAAGERFSIPADGGTIGRHPRCSIVLEGPRVEDFHAQLYFESGEPYLLDLASRAGTAVNGKATHKQQLKAGDCLTIDRHQLRFSAPQTQPPVAPMPVRPRAPRDYRRLLKWSTAFLGAVVVFAAILWLYPHFRKYKVEGQVLRQGPMVDGNMPPPALAANVEVCLIKRKVARDEIAVQIQLKIADMTALIESSKRLTETLETNLAALLSVALKISEDDAKTTVKSFERDERNVDRVVKQLERAAKEPRSAADERIWPVSPPELCINGIQEWREAREKCAKEKKQLDEILTDKGRECNIDEYYNFSFARTQPILQRTKSGADGHFSFQNVPYGEYVLFAESDGDVVKFKNGVILKRVLVWLVPVSATGKDVTLDICNSIEEHIDETKR